MNNSLGAGRSWDELQPTSNQDDQPSIRQRQLLYSDPYKNIVQVTANFNHFAKDYFVVEYKHRSGVVVVRNNKVLLVRQYRLLVDGLSWEIPGGAVDDNETPKQAAMRECLEETGIHCFNLQPLLFFHVSVDTIYNPTHVFYAHDIAELQEPERVNRQEVDSWAWLPLPDCLDMIFLQKIQDSFSVTAILAYHTMIAGNGYFD